MLSVVVFAAPTSAHAAVGDYGTLEDGTYTISSYMSAQMNWTVASNGTSDGTKIVSYNHTGNINQLWKITTDSDGYSTIIAANSGKALDLQGGTAANGKQLQIYTPNGTKAQKWRIYEVTDGYRIDSAVDESYSIDLKSKSTENLAAIQIWTGGNAPQRTWHLDKVADETNATTEKTALFDTSVYITDHQRGTITWESIPSGWTEGTAYYNGTYEMPAAMYTGGDYYVGGNATVVARVDKCGKVNDRWISVRLTFSNINSKGQSLYYVGTGFKYAQDKTGNTSIGFDRGNIWNGLYLLSIDFLDMNVEVFYTDTGETISLDGAWLTGASLNAKNTFLTDVSDRGESIRYLTDKSYNSYLIEGNGLNHKTDGTWEGGDGVYDPNSNAPSWDNINSEDFLIGAVAFSIVDEKPTFRIGESYAHRGKFMFNLSPLTIATPPSPSKNVLITG